MTDSPQPSLSGGQPPAPLPDLSAYAGCWVALVGDEVAGVGATAEAAQMAARRSRPRERIRATLWAPESAPSQALPPQVTPDA
ncbi:MAG TPA: hypothetical protein PKM78_07275 [Anaerolineae bacterium]|nr:hypothetical protein [Anaerolineae bacterium]HNU04974.1 hypothetical protein [Anaerolineae bacterium]